MTMLLQELSANEIRQLLSLEQEFKKRYESVMLHMLAVARERDINDLVTRLGLTTQCLLTAAKLFPGARETFLDAAGSAFDTIERTTRPKTEEAENESNRA